MEQIQINEERAIEEQPKPKVQDSEALADVKMVKALFEQAKKARAEYDGEWAKRWDFYKEKQWDKQSASYASKPVYNVLRMTVQGLLPILTDARPGFNAQPAEPGDYQLAALISKLTEFWWNKSGVNMDSVLIEGLMDMMILDAGVLKVTWDPEAEGGAGEIKCESIDPNDIYTPKGASDFDKAAFVIQRCFKPVGELKRLAPEFADQIKADSDKGKDADKAESIDTEVKIVSPTDQHKDADNNVVNNNDDRKMAEVWECWMDDHTLEEYVEEIDGKQEKKLKKKYPGGVLISILPNQNIRLWKVSNPYKRCKNPFVRLVDSILPRQIWGEGEAGPLITMQRVLNKTLGIIMDYMNLMGNPVWMVEEDSGVDPNSITNQCGLVITVAPGANAGGKVRRDIPPPLPEYIFRFFETVQRMTETISGMHDVTQGRRPAGVTAASAINELQEAGHTRVRLKERNMQISLSQLGHKVINLMLQYYKEPRVARVTGESQAWPKFFDFYFEEADGAYTMKRREYIADKEKQTYTAPNEWEQYGPTKGVFDIRVMSGTAMPFAKAQRSNLALQLRQGGDLSREGLYEALEWPKAEEELNRLKEQEQAAAAAAPPQGAK